MYISWRSVVYIHYGDVLIIMDLQLLGVTLRAR
jgi:hypothetical protein